MTDPAHFPVVPMPSPEGTGTGTPRRHRQRLFTPVTDASPAQPKPRRRMTSLARPHGGNPRPLPLPPPPAPASGTHHAPVRPSSRPAFAPNPAIPFLQRVHASSDPAGLERLIAGLGRSLAFAGLGTAVAAVIASAFVFHSPHSSSTAATAPRDVRTTAAPPPAWSRPEPARTLGEALSVLASFLATTSARDRQEMIESSESLPDPLTRDGQVPALAAISVDPVNARLHQHPTLTVALVPVTDARGLPRTAALVHSGDRWRIDWRSVFTPEDQEWEAFARGSVPGVSQFRVHVSLQPDGIWTVGRLAGGHDHVAASVARGSRVAQELETELDARGGTPLPADVFLENRPGTPLNIVDWTRDKWSM